MIQKDCERLQKGQLVYFGLDNMIGMIVDIKEKESTLHPEIKVEWFIDNKIVVGHISKQVAVSRRNDYKSIFLED